MGGGGGGAPEPSVEERALQSEQLKILKEQQATSSALEPYYLKSLGLKKVGGEYIALSEDEKYAMMTEEEKYNTDISKLQQARTQKALKGEIEVSPALESNLSQQQADLEEYLSRRLGKNWRLSTPGITKLGEFKANAESMREAQRYGEIDSGTGLMLAQQNAANEAAKRANTGYNFLGTNQLGMMGQYNSAMSPYQSDAARNLQAQIVRNQNTANVYKAIGSAAGQVAGAYMSGGKGSATTPNRYQNSYLNNQGYSLYK